LETSVDLEEEELFGFVGVEHEFCARWKSE
jgi:hypothetical protein